MTALKDILEAIDRYVGSISQAELLQNTEKQDAVVRNLEIIISESVNKGSHRTGLK